MSENRCIICYEIIPEGRIVCPLCYARTMNEQEEQPIERRKEVKRTMKKINWGVRFANEKFWLTFIPALLLVVSLILDLFGVKVDFGEIGNKLVVIVKAVFALLGILGIVVDPTTEGIKDSERAMTYREPYKDFVEEED